MTSDAEETDGPSLAERLKTLALLAGGSAIFFWQLRHPIVRFDWGVLNDLFGFALGSYLPWAAVAAVFRLGGWWSKAIGWIAVIPMLLYSRGDRAFLVHDGAFLQNRPGSFL